MNSDSTLTVKVLPDLTEFEEILARVPDSGLTVTEDTSFEYDDRSGRITRQVLIRTITKATER